MERSLIFTLLLHHDPDFGSLPMARSAPRITECLEAWRASDSTNMGHFVKGWVAEHPVEVSV